MHDEYLVETNIENASLVGSVMKASIKQAGEELESRCPLDGAYKIGVTWAQVH